MFGIAQQQRRRCVLNFFQAAILLVLVVHLVSLLSGWHMPVLSVSAFLVLLVVVAGMMFFMLYFQRQTQDIILSIKDTIETIDHGLIYFDRQNALTSYNPKTAILLPEIENPVLHNLNTFLAFIYDHSIEGATDLQSQLGFHHGSGEKTMFQELIRTKQNKLLLIKVHQHATESVIAMITDVTLINDQHERMADLLKAIDIAPAGVLIADARDAAWPIIFMNRECHQILEQNPRNTATVSLEDLMREKTPDLNLERIFDLLKFGQPSVFHFQKNERWYEMFLSPVFGNEGQHLITAFLLDQTDQKQHEEHMIQAQKMEAMGHLAGGVAHDFNNLLSIIDGYARTGRKGNTNEAFDHIQRAVEKGSAVIKRMLLFGGHHISNGRVLNLADCLRQDEVLLRPLIPANIDLRFVLMDRSMPIECAPDSISQIVVNLVLNACDAIEGKGVVTISAYLADEDCLTPAGSMICLDVTDTGVGIDTENLNKIFDPFFTTKAPDKGTGLGLSMVYGLVRQMNGRIKVDSQKGEGTRFRVYIPRSEKPLTTKQVEGDPDDIGTVRLEGYTALIAEDQPELLQIMRVILMDHGLNVLTAQNGEEALVVQDEYEGDIDFLITDVVMPGLDGIKLAELMREVRPETQTVFVSGYPAKGQMAAFNLPQDAIFLAKPVSPDILVRLLYALTQSAQAAERVKFVMPHWNNTSTRKEYLS